MSSGVDNPDGVRRSLRPRRLLRVGAAAAAVLVVALPAAGDTPSVGHSQQSRSLAGKTPPLGTGDYQQQVIQVQHATAEARKAKVHFVFPDVYLNSNVVTCIAPPDSDSYFPASDTATERCPELFRIPLPSQYQDPAGNASITGGVLDAYIVTTRGGKNARNTYGSFPAVKVHALVFGSIPVSATVRLEQTVTNGYLDPIRGQYAAVTNLTNTGGLAYPGFSPIPPLPAGFPADTQQAVTFKNNIDATLRLRLSDVAVDGHSVDIGAHCGTESPVRLTVRSPLGYSVDPGAAPPRTRGLPGYFLPIFAVPGGGGPGYFDGNANIPAFTGCGSPTENLDPLLTALISSPRNPVTGYLPYGALEKYFCTSPIADNTCTPALAATQRRMKALTTAVAEHKSSAEIRKLAAKLKPSDYVMPKVKPNGETTLQ